MKADFEIDVVKQLITATYKGSIHINDLKECISHLFRNPEFREEFNGISDFRNAELLMDLRAFYEFRGWLDTQDKASKGRWAVLVGTETDQNTIELWERMSDGYHEGLRVFTDEDKAKIWLSVF